MINLCLCALQVQKLNISWETIAAIIGALAWIPWIFDKLISSKIYGNVISYVFSKGHFNGNNGLLYFFKLSITCLNKNFNIKSIDIFVKYPNSHEWKNGAIFWARNSSWQIGDSQKQLVLPNDNFLGFINVFEKDKSNFYYLTFLVEHSQLQKFEVMKFEFTDYKNNKKSFEIFYEELNEDRMLFDDNIWK